MENIPELVIRRRDEEAAAVLATVVMKTGKMILEESERMAGKGEMNRREKGWIKINTERWNTLASQTQEMIHVFIMTKGK